MKKTTVCFLVLASSLLGLDSRLAKADYYYSNNHLDQGYLARARYLCESVLEDDASQPQALWRIARIYLAMAEGRLSKTEKLATYEIALDYAEQARKIAPTSPDAQYIYGVILGRTAQERGILNFITQIKAMKSSFETALKLDANHTGALHGLGIWYAEASAFYPAWKEEAEKYLNKAIASDPNRTMPYITLAKFYVSEKRYAEARELLKRCLAVENPTEPAEFANYSGPEARKMLAEIQGK